MSIVAEGAEREDEVAVLRALGVDMVQGYYFSKPLPAAEVPAWVASCGKHVA